MEIRSLLGNNFSKYQNLDEMTERLKFTHFYYEILMFLFETLIKIKSMQLSYY